MLRKNKTLTLFSLGLLSVISFTVQADPAPQHIVVAPTCLVSNLHVNYKTLSATENMSLIEVNNAGINNLIKLKIHQKTPCGGFADVTQAWNKFATTAASTDKAKLFLARYAKPGKGTFIKPLQSYSIQYPTQVNQLLGQINPQNMWTNLTTLSNFKDRYANSDNGVKAANWFKTQIETIAKNTGHNDVTVTLVSTDGFQQPSVVVKVGEGTGPGIVIGGHMDTLSSRSSIKPGADDDGSGSVTVLETARTILASGMHFKKPIYFIWYAAEEEGLYGSQNVVADFQAKNIPVDAVIQFDMTGYAYQNDPTIWLINDDVNQSLTSFLEALVNTYVKKPVKYTQCGYECSDHATWTDAGFASSFPFEAQFGHDDPYIHSSQDTMNLLSLDHMTDYAKLGVAFAVELAEPTA